MALTPAERQRAYRERKRNGVTSPPTVTLRPREMRVLANKALGMSTEAALRDAGFGTSGTMKQRLLPGGDLSLALGKLLDEENGSLKRVVGHAVGKLEATRLFNAARMVEIKDEKGVTVKVEKGTECITAADNDAQLRAAEILIDLHGRARNLPTVAQEAGGSGGLHYHLHLDGLKAQAQDVVIEGGNAVEDGELVKDGRSLMLQGGVNAE